MAQLDKVIEMINARRAGTPEPQVIERTVETPTAPPVGIDSLVELLTGGFMKPHEFQGALLALTLNMRHVDQAIGQASTAIGGMAKQMSAIEQAVASKPDSLDPVLSAVEAMSSTLKNLTKAISNIKIPAPEVKVDKPDPVDLAPLQSAMDEIKRIVSTPEADESKGEVKKAKKWVFDVKRNANGYLKSVEARENDE
jgi:hypothetical protein